MASNHPSSWDGVTCSSGDVIYLAPRYTTHVRSISFGLRGAIPSELGNLANLKILSLSSNQLSGPIPPELGNLTNLYVLNLSFNQVSGPIPLSFIGLKKLSYFIFEPANLCEPDTDAFKTWKTYFVNWNGTGLTCLNSYLPLVISANGR